MTRWFVLCVAIMIGSITSAHASEPRCVVNDPTGTPLNIRESPNGPIVLTAENGEVVLPTRTINVGGKKWTEISEEKAAVGGWVFASYIHCNGNIKEEKARKVFVSTRWLADGRTAWSHQVEEILLSRGFSRKNAYKYSYLNNFGASNPGHNANIDSSNRSILTNTEKPQLFSTDPVVFARQLPACYAVDEARDCKLLYSGWGDLYGGPANGSRNDPDQCRMTETQRAYCRKNEFSDRERAQGCGRDYGGAADLVVFDGPQDTAPTKLAFSDALPHRPANTTVAARSETGVSKPLPRLQVCKGHPAG